MTKSKTYKALTIAKFFLSISDEESGDLVSNLKLQKLLYYAQGYWVGLNGCENPLFDEDVFAWKHGPVIADIYHHYSSYADKALPKENKPRSIDGEVLEFLEEIYRTFGRYSAWALREMTHRESPWLDNYTPNKKDIEISLKDLESFFKGKIKRASEEKK